MDSIESRTSDVRRENALTYERSARWVAEDINRRKDEFIAAAVHELRQPLAPMLAALEIMKLQAGREHGERARRVVEKQLSQLIHLIEGLMDATRINEAKARIELEPVDLRGVIGDAIEAADSVAQSKCQNIRLISVDTEALVTGDAARLLQVFTNLLSNASKFSPPGSLINVSLDLQDADVRIDIEDQGRGIHESDLPHIFEIYRQSSAGEKGGLGIGLYVVRGLVELHGGTVEAKSGGAGLGSVFSVRLPRTGRD